MDKIQIVEIEGIEYVVIDRGDAQFTSMTKTHWDKLQAQEAEHLNGSVDGEAL